jgi:hypothetical protein
MPRPADDGVVLGFSGRVTPESKTSTPDWWLIQGGFMIEEARMEGSQALGDGEHPRSFLREPHPCRRPLGTCPESR